LYVHNNFPLARTSTLKFSWESYVVVLPIRILYINSAELRDLYRGAQPLSIYELLNSTVVY